MIISVLGSSGQIGAYLTEYLRDKGHEVIEIDKNLGPQHNLTVFRTSLLSFRSNAPTLCLSWHLMSVVLDISRSINTLSTL